MNLINMIIYISIFIIIYNLPYIFYINEVELSSIKNKNTNIEILSSIQSQQHHHHSQ